MCGIFGYITKKNTRLTSGQKDTRNRILSGLAVSMESRGDDSTGIAGIDQGNIKLFKRATFARDFITLPGYKKLTGTGPDIIIGHTRLATTGAINDINSHPYQFGTITGVHNGIISNWKDINPTVEVDSMVIFDDLNKTGNNFINTFSKLSGNFAIVWNHAPESDSLYMVSSGNPLSLARIPELDTIFYCSELNYLLPVITVTTGLKGVNYWEPKENTVYKIESGLKIRKFKVNFKPGYIYDYKNYQAWDNYRDEYTGPILPEPDNNPAYTLQDTLLWIQEADSCESCLKPINGQPFYYNKPGQFGVCLKCAKKMHINGHRDYQFYTRDSIDTLR